MSFSSRQVLLHPLCLASICDHYTKIIVGGTRLPCDSPVIGILLGTQSDGGVTLFDISEAFFDVSPDSIALRVSDVKRVVALRTAVFANYEVVGWFAVTPEILPFHSKIHQDMAEFTQNPIFLQILHPMIHQDSKALPVRLWEGSTCNTFQEISFKLETGQVEKLAIDEVTKQSYLDGGTGIEIQNQSMISSVQTLGEKIDVILATLVQMQNQQCEYNPNILRKAAKICRILNTSMSGDALDAALSDQIDESTAIALLASATKATANISELADTYAMAYADRHISKY